MVNIRSREKGGNGLENDGSCHYFLFRGKYKIKLSWKNYHFQPPKHPTRKI